MNLHFALSQKPWMRAHKGAKEALWALRARCFANMNTASENEESWLRQRLWNEK